MGVVEKEKKKFSIKNWRSGIPGYSEIVLREVKGITSSKLIHFKTWWGGLGYSELIKTDVQSTYIGGGIGWNVYCAPFLLPISPLDWQSFIVTI